MALFDTWLEIHNNSITEALKHLNNKLGTKYQHGRFNQWRKGSHLPTSKVLALIYTETLNYALPKLEKDTAIQTLILEELSLPVQKKS